MSTVSPPPSDLEQLAEIAHQHLAGATGPRLVLVEPDDRGGPVVRSAPIPHEHPHPAEVFIGRRVQHPHTAVGLITSCRLHQLAGPHPVHEAIAPHLNELQDIAEAGGAAELVILADRHGACTTRISSPTGDPEPLVIRERPEGWAADVLARCLGLATPPPSETIGRFVETHWLNALAVSMAEALAHRLTWAQVAALHPFAPGVEPIPGALLAMETAAFEAGSSWSSVRLRHGHGIVTCCPPPPRGLDAVPLDEWFDDGSFSRWLQRDLGPVDDLVDLVLDGLPEAVAVEVIDALTTVAVPTWWVHGRP